MVLTPTKTTENWTNIVAKKFRKISGDLLADQVSIPSIYCSFNLLEDGGLGILMLNTRRRLSVFPISEYFFSLFQSVVFQYYVLLQENSSFYFNSLHGHVCHWLGLSKLLRSSFSHQDFLSLANVSITQETESNLILKYMTVMKYST